MNVLLIAVASVNVFSEMLSDEWSC